MDTIFMNSENSKISDPHRLLLNLTDKRNLKRSDKYVLLSNTSIYCKCQNTRKSYKNNKSEISAPTWNDKLELLDGSYCVSDIKDYFKYIMKKHEIVTDNNPQIKIYVYKIENRITFKIKTGFYLKFFAPETMKLLGSTKIKITKDKNGQNIPHL